MESLDKENTRHTTGCAFPLATIRNFGSFDSGRPEYHESSHDSPLWESPLRPGLSNPLHVCGSFPHQECGGSQEGGWRWADGQPTTSRSRRGCGRVAR